MTNIELTTELADTKHEITELRQQIEYLERRTEHKALPDTMLLDHSFLKRAFAVYGHTIVAGLIIALPFYCLFFFLALVGS